MDGIVFSCEVQELKPEEGIYRKLLKMYQLEPEKSVFLDDRAENCEGAGACGIHAIRFKDFKQAVRELKKAWCEIERHSNKTPRKYACTAHPRGLRGGYISISEFVFCKLVLLKGVPMNIYSMTASSRIYTG